MEGSIPHTTPSAERLALSDAERVSRLASLAERLRSPDGLDHDTLRQIEQLTGDEQ